MLNGDRNDEENGECNQHQKCFRSIAVWCRHAHYDKVDSQIDSARNEADAIRQAALWKDAQTAALSDMVTYPILYQNQVYARSTNVDYGHELNSVIQLYPGIDERTRLLK